MFYPHTISLLRVATEQNRTEQEQNTERMKYFLVLNSHRALKWRRGIILCAKMV